jgi:hypothetical protein
MAPRINEKHPKGLGIRTKTKINQQKAKGKSKKTSVITTQ